MGIARLPTKIHIQVGIWCMKVVLLEWLCWLCLLHEHVNTSVVYELWQKYSVCILCIYIYICNQREREREREIHVGRSVVIGFNLCIHLPLSKNHEFPCALECNTPNPWLCGRLFAWRVTSQEWKTRPFPYCCYDELIMRYLLFSE